MKRIGTAVASLLAVSVVCSPALASSVHLKGPVSLVDNGTTLSASGQLAGLGNRDVLVGLQARAHARTMCANPAGYEAPGQNPADVVVAGAQSIPVTEIKNGTTPFSVTTEPPPAPPTWREAGCPNANWTARITSLEFTGATLTVEQGGATVLRKGLAL